MARGSDESPSFDASLDRESLRGRLTEYLASLERRNYSPFTLKYTKHGIEHFIAWCAEQAVTRPEAVTAALLERYGRHLRHLRTTTGATLALQTQYRELSAIRCFFRFLARRNWILFSPANDLELPKLGNKLARTVLTHEEMERVLAQPDLLTDLGVRDRAILETLYSTGIRRSELVHLCVFDLDAPRGTLTVRQGKGKKDRVVPIGERALDWIDRYLSNIRPQLMVDPNVHALFVTAYGEALSADGLASRVSRYVDAASIGKKGACHLFRHTMATQMLERGADVRIIQEILGHASVDTTQLYAQVTLEHLKDVHRRTHPAVKVENDGDSEASKTALPPGESER